MEVRRYLGQVRWLETDSGPVLQQASEVVTYNQGRAFSQTVIWEIVPMESDTTTHSAKEDGRG